MLIKVGLCALCLALLSTTTFRAAASGRETPWLAMKTTLYKEFDRPSEFRYLRAKTVGDKLAIELCLDICDFVQGPAKHEALIWTVAFLVVSYGDTSKELPAFISQNQELANIALSQQAAKCGAAKDERSKAVCVVSAIQRKTGIRVGGVRYDEGERCVFWSDQPIDPKKLTPGGCTPVQR